MPLIWLRKFSATRSADITSRAGPVTLATKPPTPIRSPSATLGINTTPSPTSRNAAAARSSPAITPASRADRLAVACAPGDRVAWLVRSPARPRSSSSAAATARSTRWRGNWAGRRAGRDIARSLSFGGDVRVTTARCNCQPALLVLFDRVVGGDDRRRQAPGRWIERDQAGLQRVVDIGLAGEQPRFGREVFTQLAQPAAALMVDHMVLGIIPQLAIPDLEIVLAVIGAEERRGTDRLADRPP